MDDNLILLLVAVVNAIAAAIVAYLNSQKRKDIDNAHCKRRY